jgi:periplasmic protein TonB
MGYQALLFCPDEKTARTVTRVLSELEFSIETCTEPFAAVKKLMGQHFDAVVVDCDNEQNATLLFKSARNSTSNQASLAVAVVEGQAGVAKAFRIGANLVLTKPINIEQAKGTLRVARGLLRKSEPGKASPLAAVPSPAAPIAAKPAPPAKSATPAVPPVVLTAPAASVPVAMPGDNASRPSPTVAASSGHATIDPVAIDPATNAPVANSRAANDAAVNDEDLLDIGWDDSVATPTPGTPAYTPAYNEARTPFTAGLPSSPGSGAGSATAPAREPLTTLSAALAARRSEEADVLESSAEASQNQVPAFVGSAPTFTFGGSLEPEESTGGSKKIFLGIAAAAIVAAGIYGGWAHFHGNPSAPVVNETPASTGPVASPQPAKPSYSKPSASAPKTSVPSPSSQGAASLSASLPAKSKIIDETDSVTGEADQSVASKPEAAPLVVQGGKSPVAHPKSSAPDAPAPSMIGMATAGAAAPPPDLGSSEESQPRPVLQTLSVSQGVSQGLLMRKVQPIYPKNALFMRVEGSVELMATISKTGDISRVKVVSGDAQLTRAASDAVKQWKYKPYLLNGEPVEIQTQVTINFKLPK